MIAHSLEGRYVFIQQAHSKEIKWLRAHVHIPAHYHKSQCLRELYICAIQFQCHSREFTSLAKIAKQVYCQQGSCRIKNTKFTTFFTLFKTMLS